MELMKPQFFGFYSQTCDCKRHHKVQSLKLEFKFEKKNESERKEKHLNSGRFKFRGIREEKDQKQIPDDMQT